MREEALVRVERTIGFQRDGERVALGIGELDAVAEAAVGDLWRVVDATLLAPRSSLIRIATGRDAADTAFLTSYGAQATLLESTVTATTDGMLPGDDVTELISIT